MGWWFFKKRKAQARVGIGLDEPIEVSPGKFVTARDMAQNAASPEEFDERLRSEAATNPELAKTLEQHFGWKDGTPPDGAVPVVTQIVDALFNEKQGGRNGGKEESGSP